MSFGNDQKSIWAVAFHGSTSVLQKYLNESPDEVVVNYQDDETGTSALMHSVLRGDQEAVDMLLHANASINLQDKHGCTALVHAARAGKDEILHTLIDIGANVHLKDKVGGPNTFPKPREYESAHPYSKHTRLQFPVEIPGAEGYTVSFDDQSSTQKDKHFLVIYEDGAYRKPKDGDVRYSGGCDGSEKTFPGVNGLPPLRIDSRKFVVYFQSDGEQVDWGYKFTVTPIYSQREADANGWSALMWAAYMGHGATVDLLIRAGADLEERGWDGNTALALSVQGFHEEASLALHRAGARLDAKNKAGISPIEKAVQNDFSSFIRELLKELNPFAAADRLFTWHYILANTECYCEEVAGVLDRHVERLAALISATDSNNRRAIDVAMPTYKSAVVAKQCFFGCYDIYPGPPSYITSGNIVCMAKMYERTGTGATREVSLKFMRNKADFDREVSVRAHFALDDGYVVGIIQHHNGDEDAAFLEAASRRGYYPYCIVTEAIERTLSAVLTCEHVAGRDWHMIRSIGVDILQALNHMHSKGLMHGNVKPSNIVRHGGRYKLTNLEASVVIGEVCPGSNSSTAYLPPELFVVMGKEIVVRGADIDSEGKLLSDSPPYSLVPASEAQDMWAFGVLMYQLCSGRPLFITGTDDGIGQESLDSLFNWTDETKAAGLSSIRDADADAKNVLSRLLSKDPFRRPNASRVLAHQFFSLRRIRFDVLISYAVADTALAEAIYETLTKEGLRVWFDKKSLDASQSWEDGFVDGLMSTLIFLPLVSKDVINDDNIPWQYRLALELNDKCLLGYIIPVFVGETADLGDILKRKYSKFYIYEHSKDCPETAVDAVETKLRTHLHRHGLGDPMQERVTIKDIFVRLDPFLAIFFSGLGDEALSALVAQVTRAVSLRRERLVDDPFESSRRDRDYFLSGKGIRFDVFLSYREATDGAMAVDIHNALTKEGVRVFVWDTIRLLELGRNWEHSCRDGLANSLLFLPLISKGAVNSDTKPRLNFSNLHKGSRRDCVLIEHRLSMELKEMGIPGAVIPILIGESADGGRTFDRFDQLPSRLSLPDTEVDSVEAKVREHLSRLGLGLPLREKATVKEVYTELLSFQSCYVQGAREQALTTLVTDIKNALRSEKQKLNLKKALSTEIARVDEPFDIVHKGKDFFEAYFLKYQDQIHYCDKNGDSIFMKCVREGYRFAIEWYFGEDHFDLSDATNTITKSTALMYAVENDDDLTVKELIKLGCSAYTYVDEDKRKFSYIEIVCKKGFQAETDKAGNIVLDAVACNTRRRSILETLLRSCPVISEEGDLVPDSALTWIDIVSETQDMYLSYIGEVLDKHPEHVKALAELEDSRGRKALNVATELARKEILDRLLFYKRYEFREEEPLHESLTCVVRLATDHEGAASHGAGDVASKSVQHRKKQVALKFMTVQEQFERELKVREECKFDEHFILGILHSHNGDVDESFRNQMSTRMALITRSVDKVFPYCLVMPVADRDLAAVILHERLVERRDEVRLCFQQIVGAVQHIHSKGYVHGDLKPFNIMRVGGNYLLIDLDASVGFHPDRREYVGVKTSTAYMPPEMVEWVDAEGRVLRLKLPPPISDGVLADPSFDMWSLGVTLYQLLSGVTLFHATSDDNMAPGELEVLCDWADDVKDQKLQGVRERDPVGANLLSRLLSKDPSLRPDPSRVLSHPYITRKATSRMVGDEADFHVFISYRVASDKDLAEVIYTALTAAGLKVWWDAKCLEKGKKWEAGFCDGLVRSAVFLPLLSKDAVNSDSVPWQNYSKLTKTSRCDNVLLEHRLALELTKMGLIDAVYPILIGEVEKEGLDTVVISAEIDSGVGEEVDDKDKVVQVSGLIELRGQFETRRYAEFNQFHLPFQADTEVDAVEVKLREHLDRQGLGMPLSSKATVREVYTELTAFQGFKLQGYGAHALVELVNGVKEVVAGIKSAHGHSSGSERSRGVSKTTPLDYESLKAEVASLRDYQAHNKNLIRRLGQMAPHLTRK